MLLLVLGILLALHPSTSTIVFPIVTGNSIKDLYFFGSDIAKELAKKWVVNGTADENQVKTSFCFYNVLGGINITPAGSSLSRTYTNLPSHGIVFYQFWLSAIDDWQSGQKIHINFDNRVVFSYEPYLYVSTEGSTRCGTSTLDTFVKIMGTAYHSSSNLTFSITTDSGSSQASFMITDFKAFLRDQGTFSETSCVRTLLAPSSVPGTCPCSENQYYNTTSSSCVNCHFSCEGCFGPTASECNLCDSYDTNAGKCVGCTTNCAVCTGSAVNQCKLCVNSNLTAAGTCESTCASQYVYEKIDLGFCNCPTGQYPDSNGQCLACHPECLECTSPTACTSCDSGTSLINGKCQCPSGKFFIQGFGCAGTCSQGCNHCINDTACTECYSGPSLVNGQCQCPQGKYYVQGSGCTGTCSLGCNKCQSDTVCTECDSSASLVSGKCECSSGSYYIHDSGCSGTCSIGCKKCSNDTVCTKCYPGPSLANGQCQCPIKKYFIPDSGCTGQCSLGCQNCINSSVCEACMSQTSLQPSGDCKCNAAGFFYDKSQDTCTGICPTNCDYCNNATVCIECKTGMMWQDPICECPSPKLLMDSTCYCPSGTFENTQTSLCDSIIALEINYQAKVSPYANLVLQAVMTPEEEASFTPVFEWSFSSNTANAIVLSSLKGYLSSQTNKNLLVLPSYLEPSTTYTVKANYTNAQNQSVSKSVLIETTGMEMQISIKGGSLQTLDYSVINTVAAEVVSPTGPVSSSLLDITWSQSGGNPLSLASLTNSQKPLLLSIPKCTLTVGKSYNFGVTAKQKGTSNSPSTAQLNITSPRPKLTVTIPDGNRGQKANKNLFLEPILGIEDPCNLADINTIVNISSRQAEWECSKVDSQGVSSLCDDPDHIFYPPQGMSSLTVPSSYFSQNVGAELIFKVKITVKSISGLDLFSASTQTSFTIFTPDSTAVSLSQSSPSLYQVTLENNTQHNYNYSWELPSEVQYVSFNNQLKILTDMSTLAPLTSVRAKMIATDELGHTTSLYYQLLINQAPTSGMLTVTPNTGTSLDTDFFVSTSGWLDDDIPLTYQFLYSSNQTDGYKSLTSTQLSSYTSTKLVSTSSQTKVYVKVIVTDYIGATNFTSVVVNVQPNLNISDVTTRIQELLSLKSDVSPVEMNNLFTLASDTLNSIETMYTITDGCPFCSGHGQCLNSNQCKCQVGYTLADCSMLQTQYDSVMSTKTALLNVMQESVSSIAVDTTTKDAISQTLATLSSSTIFNNVQTLTTVQNVIEAALNLNNPQTVLTTSQSIDLSNILSNMLSYASQTDSTLDGQFSQNLENKMNQYLSTISDSLLAGMLPGEDPVVITTPNFGMYVAKSTPCTLSSQNLTISPDYPTLQVSSNDTQNCSTSLDIKYYAVNASLFGNSGDPNKVVIALDIRNSDTKEQVSTISVKVIPGGNHQCPVGCESFECECLCADMFDIKAQFAKVFRKSNLGKLGNIEALVGFKFWESLAVWCAIGFTTWFLVSLYLVKSKMPHYNITNKVRNKKKALIPKLKKGKILLLITHPVLGIYFYDNSQLSKVTKLILYYQQLIFLLTYTAVFPTASKENQFVAKIILIVLKSVTITPLTLIITWLIKDPDSNEQAPITWFSRNKRKMGIILSTLCTLGCFYIIIIISAQTDSNAQAEWTLNFLIVLIQGLFVSPPIVLAVQVILILYMASKISAKIPLLKTIFSRAINKDTENRYAEVCVDQSKTLFTQIQETPRLSEAGPIALPSPPTELPPHISLQEIPIEFSSPADSPTRHDKGHPRILMLSENIMSRRGSAKDSDVSQLLHLHLYFHKASDSPLNGGDAEEKLFVADSPFRRLSKFRNVESSQKKRSEDIS